MATAMLRPAPLRPTPLPGPPNLVHPSRIGIEGGPGPGEALVAPGDGVDSTPETGVGGRAPVAPDPAEIPGQVVPDPAVPDPEAGARRAKPSWEGLALNRAKPTRLIHSTETLLGVLTKSAGWGLS